MIQPISNQDNDRALKGIYESKAPGIDGFNSFFFKKSWNVIRDTVCDVMKEFFDKALLHKPLNFTSIALIPKVENVIHAKDFRLITCSIVIYKIISMIITNRMQSAINELVNDSQARFMPDRHVLDNILLAT